MKKMNLSTPPHQSLLKVLTISVLALNLLIMVNFQSVLAQESKYKIISKGSNPNQKLISEPESISSLDAITPSNDELTCMGSVCSNELLPNNTFPNTMTNADNITVNGFTSDYGFDSSIPFNNTSTYSQASNAKQWISTAHSLTSRGGGASKFLLFSPNSNTSVRKAWKSKNISVVPGRTYRFSACISNSTDPSIQTDINTPIFEFKILYVTLGQEVEISEPIEVPQTPNPEWKRKCVETIIPPNVTSVSISITQILPGALNNTSFAIDDVSFKIKNTSDSYSYTETNGGTWTGTNNPINNGSKTVSIGSQLTIKSGVNLTIRDMTFKMGAGARVVVEQGATLNLLGCIFEGSDLCQSVIWEGIRVLGIGLNVATETLIADADNTGNLNLGSYTTGGTTIKSRISHASVAIRNADMAFNGDDFYPVNSGGLVNANNVTFSNNNFGIIFHPVGPENINNFYTNAIIKNTFTQDAGWRTFNFEAPNDHPQIHIKFNNYLPKNLDFYNNEFSKACITAIELSNSPQNLTFSTFTNNNIGFVSRDIIKTLEGSTTSDNVFDGYMNNAIENYGTSFNNISNNTFKNLTPATVGELKNPINETYQAGIYAQDDITNLTINNNTFENISVGTRFENAGAELAINGSLIRENNFNNSLVNQVYFKNDNLNVYLNCNNLKYDGTSTGYTNWVVTGDLLETKFSNQIDLAHPAGNKFIGTNTSRISDIISNDVPFKYFYKQGAVSENPRYTTLNKFATVVNVDCNYVPMIKSGNSNGGIAPNSQRRSNETEYSAIDSLIYFNNLIKEGKTEEAENVLKTYHNLDAKVLLIGQYLNTNRMASATEVLATMASKLSNIEYSTANSYYGLLINNKLNNNNLYQLDNEQISLLESIAENNTKTSVLARNLLVVYYGYKFDEYTEYINVTPTEQTSNIESNAGTLTEIKIYPNPVQNNVIIVFKQDMIGKQAKISIMNALGSEVFTKNSLVADVNQSLDITNLATGIYHVQVLVNGQTFNQKIQISK